MPLHITVVAGELAVFVVGTYTFITGATKLSRTKIVNKRRVRLGGLISMLPLPMIILIARITTPQPDISVSLPNLMNGPVGILMSIVGFIVGAWLINTSPIDSPTKTEESP